MNNTMKKLLLILAMFLTFLGIIMTASAAPTTQYFVNLAPFTDQTYNNGASSLAWLNTFTQGLTLSTSTAGCLATSPTGIVFAGSPCGSGSGTVDTGSTGQFPFYKTNGTTLTATSTLFTNQVGQIRISPTITSIPGNIANLTVFGNHLFNDQAGVIEACDTVNTEQCIYMGYDHANGFAYIQSIQKQNSFDSLIFNPSGGKVSVGQGNGPVIADFQVDHQGVEGNTYGTNINFWAGNTDGNLNSLSQYGAGNHSSAYSVPPVVFGAQIVGGDNISTPNDFVLATKRGGSSVSRTAAPAESLRVSAPGILEVGSTTPNYGFSTLAAQALFASSTAPALSLEGIANTPLWNFRVLSDDTLVIATSSPLTGATTTAALVISPNGQLGIGTSTPSQQLDVNGNVSIENANGILMKDTVTGSCSLITLDSGILVPHAHSCE